MKFSQYLAEQETLEEAKIELTTVEGKKHEKALGEMGFDVSSDAEGVVVEVKTRGEKKKLREYMMKNGWDKVDIQDGYPELMEKQDNLDEALLTPQEYTDMEQAWKGVKGKEDMAKKLSDYDTYKDKEEAKAGELASELRSKAREQGVIG